MHAKLIYSTGTDHECGLSTVYIVQANEVFLASSIAHKYSYQL